MACFHVFAFRHAPAAMLLFSMLGAGASAQPADRTYDGTWAVQLTPPQGKAQAATLVLKDFEGTWQDRRGAPRAAASACAAKKIPITVQASTTLTLVFTVWGEVVAPGCPTLSLTVRPRGDTHLEGLADLGVAGSASRADPAAPPGSAGSVRLTLRR
jgi:hypothetical protein